MKKLYRSRKKKERGILEGGGEKGEKTGSYLTRERKKGCLIRPIVMKEQISPGEGGALKTQFLRDPGGEGGIISSRAENFMERKKEGWIHSGGVS